MSFFQINLIFKPGMRTISSSLDAKDSYSSTKHRFSCDPLPVAVQATEITCWERICIFFFLAIWSLRWSLELVLFKMFITTLAADSGSHFHLILPLLLLLISPSAVRRKPRSVRLFVNSNVYVAILPGLMLYMFCPKLIKCARKHNNH